MGRPVYPHEMCDPDFAWLISSFREQNPQYVPIESALLPVVLLAVDETVKEAVNELDQLTHFLESDESQDSKEPTTK